LLRIVVVDFKEEIPCVRTLNKEEIGNEFGIHISYILRSKQGVYPALKFIEMKRRIAAIYSDSPLFPSRNKRDTAFHPYISATGEDKEQTGDDKQYPFRKKFFHEFFDSLHPC
jgi:hypothetical protein